jgi:hypothetical protein
MHHTSTGVEVKLESGVMLTLTNGFLQEAADALEAVLRPYVSKVNVFDLGKVGAQN